MNTFHHANTRDSSMIIAHLCVRKTLVIHVSCFILCRTCHKLQAQVLCHRFHPILPSVRRFHQQTSTINLNPCIPCDGPRPSGGSIQVPSLTILRAFHSQILKDSTILSSRTLPCCDSGLLCFRKRFWTTTCSRMIRFSFMIFSNSKNWNLFLRDWDVKFPRLQGESGMKRESLITSTQSPHFQSRSGMLNHTGGTYSLKGMMSYQRNSISEWNLRKLPDSVAFHSGEVKFRTDDVLRTADPQITLLLWIKEVEISKSIDEVLTSRSITRQHDFLDWCDDCVSLEEVLNTQSNIWKRASVEEQGAQKHYQFLRRRQRSSWFTNISVQLELSKQYKDSQLCPRRVYRMTMFKIRRQMSSYWSGTWSLQSCFRVQDCKILLHRTKKNRFVL